MSGLCVSEHVAVSEQKKETKKHRFPTNLASTFAGSVILCASHLANN
jgi:hypothetical protein